MFSLENATTSWNDLFYANADPRIRDKLFMGSPLPTLIICFSYLYVVKKVLPSYMENRKPFNTRRIMLANNLWLFLACIYFFYQASSLGWLTTYNWRCEALDTSTSSSAMAIVDLCWQFFLFKFTYMCETFIHLLGKRDDFVTKYHVVHHFTLPMTCWIITNYLPGGHATFFGWLNPGFHIVIFGYLVFVTLCPQVKPKTRWWKTFHTWLQVMQLLILFGHSLQLLFWNDCNFPIALVYVVLAHTVIIFFLQVF